MFTRNGLSLLTISPLVWAALGAVLATACGDDEPRFLSFEELCPELAADICGARNGGCCAMVDMAACLAVEESVCRLGVDAYMREASLNYDSVYAATQRNAARGVLDACGSKPVLASFFEGGLALGTPCERPSQCQSGVCTGTPPVCVEATPAPLCEPSAP
jgi:hypothetical protein